MLKQFIVVCPVREPLVARAAPKFPCGRLWRDDLEIPNQSIMPLKNILA
jgi:hypothetical protein